MAGGFDLRTSHSGDKSYWGGSSYDLQPMKLSMRYAFLLKCDFLEH